MQLCPASWDSRIPSRGREIGEAGQHKLKSTPCSQPQEVETLWEGTWYCRSWARFGKLDGPNLSSQFLMYRPIDVNYICANTYASFVRFSCFVCLFFKGGIGVMRIKPGLFSLSHDQLRTLPLCYIPFVFGSAGDWTRPLPKLVKCSTNDLHPKLKYIHIHAELYMHILMYI